MPYKDKTKQSAYQLERQKSIREAWILENGPCQHCGATENLEVDHVNPTDKAIHTRALWSRSAKVREAELSKCQVLCYDCHLEKTRSELSLRYRGVNHRDAKLTEADVLAIRDSDLPGVQLAKLYGVDKTTISDIRLRKTWRHL